MLVTFKHTEMEASPGAQNWVGLAQKAPTTPPPRSMGQQVPDPWGPRPRGPQTTFWAEWSLPTEMFHPWSPLLRLQVAPLGPCPPPPCHPWPVATAGPVLPPTIFSIGF